MWNEPTEKQLEKLPKLYETEEIPIKNKIIHMHFFIFATDWFIAEYDSKNKIFWGFVILNGDEQNAEWGYIPFSEIKEINISGIEVDRDLYWQPREAKEIEKITNTMQGRL